MTAVLRDRKTAVILTLILCLLCAILGINRTVSKKAQAYTESFYAGVYVEDGKYTSASISDILSSRANSALILASVFADCDDLQTEVFALREARRSLIDAMEARDIAAMYTANEAVTHTADALMTAAERSAVSESDRVNAADVLAELTSAQGAIDKNPYNSYIDEYDSKVMGTLPMRLMRFAVFVSGPVSFEEHGK